MRNNESRAEQLLNDIFLAANRSRAGRNAGGELMGTGQMETDLNADLTVVPRTTTVNGGIGKTGAIMAEQEKQMMESAAKSLFSTFHTQTFRSVCTRFAHQIR